jgi:hypothetical protein
VTTTTTLGPSVADIGPSGMAYDSIADDDMLSTVLSETPRCCYSYYVAKLSYSYMTVV